MFVQEERRDELTHGLEGDVMSYVCERKSRRNSRGSEMLLFNTVSTQPR